MAIFDQIGSDMAMLKIFSQAMRNKADLMIAKIFFCELVSFSNG